MDVDADAEAFITLRAALDRALRDAELRRDREAAGSDVPDDAEPQDGGEADGQSDAVAWLGDPMLIHGPAGTGPEAWPDGEDELWPEPAELSPPPRPAGKPDARYARLEGLLFPPQGAPSPEPDAVIAALQEILAQPEMEHVDRGAEVEAWLAALLYDSIPRSDPAIPLAIEHFGWDKDAGNWDQPWLFEELVRRRDALRLLGWLADPRHELHEAWRDLTSDKEGLWPRPAGRLEQVSKLLATIRVHAPAAEAFLNPRRVALWDRRLNRSIAGGLRLIFVLAWVAFAVVKLVDVFVPPRTPPPSTQTSFALTDPVVNLNPVLSRWTAGQLEMRDLEGSNPRLSAQLIGAWRDAKQRGDNVENLDGDVYAVLENFYHDELRGAPADVQAELWRLRLDRYRMLRARGDPEACPHALQEGVHGDSSVGAAETSARSAELRLRVWRSVSDPPPPRRASVDVPAPLAADAARRVGLDPVLFNDAMRNIGTQELVCKAHMGLAEAALAQPQAEATRVLRELTLLE